MKLVLISGLLLCAGPSGSNALQNLFSSFGKPTATAKTGASFGSKNQRNAAIQIEDDLLQAIDNLDGRLANSDRINELVAQLEQQEGASIPQPAIADQIYGRWRLLHTNNANTASPIQRKAVDSSKFPIYQDIIFNDQNQLIVSQVVQFNSDFELRVDALASTSAYPLEELTARKGDGKILGLNVLGVSQVGEEAEAASQDARIDFVFDEGKFDFGDRFSIPYPVPFRLPILRDAVKGWIDITYLSERVRISRGNKGTTFVLAKEENGSQES